MTALEAPVSEQATGPSPLEAAPVIPVVVLEDADLAVPMARALADGGLPVVELTLRTPAALEALSRIAQEVPDVLLGAGTIVTPDQARAAADAGAQFLVSPGATPRLLDVLADTGLPFLPGVATASEALAVLERGHTDMKFFPAQAAGGPAFLRSLASPLPAARFCPTGGVTPGNAADYLALPNVGCVGGSWLTPQRLLETADWDAVRELATAASSLQP